LGDDEGDVVFGGEAFKGGQAEGAGAEEDEAEFVGFWSVFGHGVVGHSPIVAAGTRSGRFYCPAAARISLRVLRVASRSSGDMRSMMRMPWRWSNSCCQTRAGKSSLSRVMVWSSSVRAVILRAEGRRTSAVIPGRLRQPSS